MQYLCSCCCCDTTTPELMGKLSAGKEEAQKAQGLGTHCSHGNLTYQLVWSSSNLSSWSATQHADDADACKASLASCKGTV